MLDLRPALREAKAKEQVYYKTDTHWNWRGAFAAYRVIARQGLDAGVAGHISLRVPGAPEYFWVHNNLGQVLVLVLAGDHQHVCGVTRLRGPDQSA